MSISYWQQFVKIIHEEKVTPQSLPTAIAYLTPNQHGSKYNLQAIKEVVSDYDDCGSTSSPTFTRADSLYTWCGCLYKTKKSKT